MTHKNHDHPAADVLCNCPEHIMKRRELRENAKIIDLQNKPERTASLVEDKETWDELRRLTKKSK
jgi:hypothetical protein